MSTKRDLQSRLDKALADVRQYEKFVKDLFYLHPPLKEAYYGWHSDVTFYGHYRPKYEYVANLAEAERNVATLSSADLAKIDRYLKAALEEEEDDEVE